MRINLIRAFILFLTVACLTGWTAAQVGIPNPKLKFIRHQDNKIGDKEWTIYWYEVTNRAGFPDELFAPAPRLPPCGKNENSSRTWVEVYSESGSRLYGFCALKNHDELDKVNFSLRKGEAPPRRVYIELVDRQTGKTYKSNLAKTK
jgi:hypothetical protein